MRATTQSSADRYRPKSSAIDAQREIARLSVKFNIKVGLTASGPAAYVGKRTKGLRRTHWDLEEVLSAGFTLLPWEGEWVRASSCGLQGLTGCNRDSHLILDDANRVFVALCGRPKGSDWASVISDATTAMGQVRDDGIACGAFSDDDLDHRRGKFLAFAAGVSFGGGQVVCCLPPPVCHGVAS